MPKPRRLRRRRAATVLRWTVWLLVGLLASVVFGLILARSAATPPLQFVPDPSPTASPSDPLAEYKKIPDARTMPACPKDLPPELIKLYYPQCSAGGTKRGRR
jgi:hypothetical protein